MTHKVEEYRPVHDNDGNLTGLEDMFRKVSMPSDSVRAEELVCDSDPPKFEAGGEPAVQTSLASIIDLIGEKLRDTFIEPAKRVARRVAETAENIIESGRKVLVAAAERAAEERAAEAAKRSAEHFVARPVKKEEPAVARTVAAEPLKPVVETGGRISHADVAEIPAVTTRAVEIIGTAERKVSRLVGALIERTGLPRLFIAGDSAVQVFYGDPVQAVPSVVNRYASLAVAKDGALASPNTSYDDPKKGIFSGSHHAKDVRYHAAAGTTLKTGISGRVEPVLIGDMPATENRRPAYRTSEKTGAAEDSGSGLARTGSLAPARPGEKKAAFVHDTGLGPVAGRPRNILSFLSRLEFPADIAALIFRLAGGMVYPALPKGVDKGVGITVTDHSGHEKVLAEQVESVGGNPDEGFGGSDRGDSSDSNGGQPHSEQHA